MTTLLLGKAESKVLSPFYAAVFAVSPLFYDYDRCLISNGLLSEIAGLAVCTSLNDF